jgi:hypothetical protein
MHSEEISKLLESIRPQIDNISDPQLKLTVTTLLNLVELLYSENKKLREENQFLKDENNRLKGENGKPDIKPNTQSSRNISSKKERKALEPKKSKKPRIKNKRKLEIHETIKCAVEKNTLPEDAVFKGYAEVVVQDLVIKVVNIKFLREIYYSTSNKKTYKGKLPKGWHGDYSPGVKALILDLYHNAKMTESTITSFLNTHGIDISDAAVSLILKDEFYDVLCKEKMEIVQAGLTSSFYQHTDDTSSRVNGENYHTHILCNSLYTAYFTEKKKDRLTVIKILGGGNLFYRLDQTAYEIMNNLNVANKWIQKLKNSKTECNLSEEQFNALIETIFADKKKHLSVKNRIKESCAISGYRNNIDRIPILVCDDAPQFKQITEELALCWIHQGRHYKKLTPIYTKHRELLNSFLGEFWNYYRQLLEYKISPSDSFKESLIKTFDELFTRETPYNDLNERIVKTYADKEELLKVLRYPELPLHNNPAEHEVRPQKRRQDISFQTRTIRGTEVKDAGMTIVQTAKKLGVNVYEYFLDRVSNFFKMPSLAELIVQRISSA